MLVSEIMSDYKDGRGRGTKRKVETAGEYLFLVTFH